MNPGTVLLTGANGFAGRHLARALLAAGWRVRAPLRRPAAGLPAGIETAALGDLAQPQDWGSLLDGVDAVVHAAAIAHTSGVPESLYEAVNTRATLELARAAAEKGVRRFVFLSSVRAQSGPTSAAPLSGEDAPAPTDAYGRSKLAAERGLAEIGLPWTALRPVVVYGPGVRGNVAALLRLARMPVPLPLGGLHAPRSFLSVENLASAVLFVLAQDGPDGPVLVADPQPSSLAEMLAAMRQAEGRAPWLFALPQALPAGLARLAGRGEAWERVAGALEVRPVRLLSAGWRPPVASTPEGVARWLGQEPRA